MVWTDSISKRISLGWKKEANCNSFIRNREFHQGKINMAVGMYAAVVGAFGLAAELICFALLILSLIHI